MPGLLPEQQQSRQVASGVMNLGNTCYMNAVLQALAHAPELCLALDLEPHSVSCGIHQANLEKRRLSPTVSAENEQKNRPTRKSKRSGKKSPSTQSTDSEETSAADVFDYCTLCELESHFQQVHSSGDSVAPAAFVNGFINHVAPSGFKLGVQEDSHEFLRLLIDAMQKSCVPDGSKNVEGADFEKAEGDASDSFYPFKLFRGTVESNVCCDSCNATSSTIDPIEDIGLEVSHTGGGGGSLKDLGSAFYSFTNAEPLTGYKCDKCNTLGRATKQSKMASVPPILTLHLKRFRYGSDGKPLPPPARRSREVASGGASGSAKIEGHVKFDMILDLKPFLTEALSEKQNNKPMLSRLFAVIVHAGKNSHSGHYVAYVRNVSKNEWWKMDDARISKVTQQEVLNAEAYMLFYRIVDHPVGVQLRNKQQKAAAAISSKRRPEDSVDDVDRKRKRFDCGKDWAERKTNTPPAQMSLYQQAEQIISDGIELTPEYFKDMIDDVTKGNKSVPKRAVSQADVQSGTKRCRSGLLELIYNIANVADGGLGGFFKKEQSVAVPVVEANETYL